MDAAAEVQRRFDAIMARDIDLFSWGGHAAPPPPAAVALRAPAGGVGVVGEGEGGASTKGGSLPADDLMWTVPPAAKLPMLGDIVTVTAVEHVPADTESESTASGAVDPAAMQATGGWNTTLPAAEAAPEAAKLPPVAAAPAKRRKPADPDAPRKPRTKKVPPPAPTTPHDADAPTAGAVLAVD